ncbi:uncharacterized protein LOC129780824 [Toxorhynchites rutilus septentrionalis]|uniref:uncharacterized protein LOC129780824 n=1 Tax=Toxorhynchites rutilus septentrionalis TaxID=329112 RepID=UPI00247A3A2E|nr:uncharacterized protein LOC129780824 [Toxorhynchites rutilus septentrionalis]
MSDAMYTPTNHSYILLHSMCNLEYFHFWQLCVCNCHFSNGSEGIRRSQLTAAMDRLSIHLLFQETMEISWANRAVGSEETSNNRFTLSNQQLPIRTTSTRMEAAATAQIVGVIPYTVCSKNSTS